MILTICYPVIPTFTFLSVAYVRGSRPDPEVVEKITVTGGAESGNQRSHKKNPKNYSQLIHWARMAPIIEGGIEAPIQFLLQVLFTLCFVILKKDNFR